MKALRDAASSEAPVATAEIWAACAREALETLMKCEQATLVVVLRIGSYRSWSHASSDTRAKPPSRTLMDPLTAFVEQLPQGFPAASQAARDAANKTKNLTAKAGRSTYLDQKELADGNTADPGAWGVAVVVSALEGSIQF